MKQNFVDSTTIHAVESLFRETERDPWAVSLAGQLADLFVYSDTIRYPVPAPHRGEGYDLAEEDSLLRELARRDSNVFSGKEYSTARPRTVASNYLFTSFKRFSYWVRANQVSLRRWTALHRSSWIQHRRAATTGEKYIFDLDRLLKRPDIKELAGVANIAPLDLCYAFDSVLKYPIFGELTGRGYYLNHPLRDAIKLPTMLKKKAIPPPVAVSFHNSVAQLAVRLSHDDYTSLLHELRGMVRQRGLHKMAPGQFDREHIREIAATVRLSPRLRGYSRGVGITTGIFGGLGAFPVLGTPATVVGGLISVAAAFWSGGLPRNVSRVWWLRWAMKWDIEEQAERRL